jgi:fibronectin type 3 domain-containing protein
VNEPGFEDTGVTTGERYCYAVRTVLSTDPVIESADSDEACVTAEDVAAPAAPLGVATLAVEGGVEVSWSPSPEADLARYRVFRARRDGEPELLGEVTPPSTSFKDEGAEPDRPYRYTVVALDAAGNQSPPSRPAEGRRE